MNYGYKPYKKDFSPIVFKREKKKKSFPLNFKFNVNWQLAVGINYNKLPGITETEKWHAIVVWFGPCSLVTSWTTGYLP